MEKNLTDEPGIALILLQSLHRPIVRTIARFALHVLPKNVDKFGYIIALRGVIVRNPRLQLSTAELEELELPTRHAGAFVRIDKFNEELGLEKWPPSPYRYIEGPLWEIRITGKDGIARGRCM